MVFQLMPITIVSYLQTFTQENLQILETCITLAVLMIVAGLPDIFELILVNFVDKTTLA